MKDMLKKYEDLKQWHTKSSPTPKKYIKSSPAD